MRRHFTLLMNLVNVFALSLIQDRAQTVLHLSKRTCCLRDYARFTWLPC